MKWGKKMVLDVIGLILISVTLGSFGQIYLKIGIGNLGGLELKDFLTEKIISVATNKNIVFGLALYMAATAIWLVVLSKAELTFAYPLIGLSYVITAILAKFYFNESITLLRWAGILTLILGAFLITKS